MHLELAQFIIISLLSKVSICMNNVSMNLEDFLHHYEKNLTTPLDTEKPHPKTPQLSHLAQQDLGNALKILHKIDYESIENIQDNISSIEDLSAAIQACFAQGGKVILAGCGSSGRLAAIMESLYHKHAYKDTNAPIYTLIAGGSSALIHPQESAEDQLHGALETLKKQYQKLEICVLNFFTKTEFVVLSSISLDMV